MQRIFFIFISLICNINFLALADSKNCKSSDCSCTESREAEYEKWKKMTENQKKSVTEEVANIRVEINN